MKTHSSNKIFVIIPAGGSGLRMGGSAKKQFLTIHDEPILHLAIRAFLSLTTQKIEKIVVALPEQELQDLSKQLKDGSVLYIQGGKTRSESVHRAFQVLGACDVNDIVLIHDAVRPFVSLELIERVIHGTILNGAVIPVTPLTDTIKQINDRQQIEKTLDRNRLCAAQTPQGFLFGTLKRAYATLDFSDPRYTDESLLAEALGETVTVVEGERENIKITTPFDLRMAEWLFQK